MTCDNHRVRTEHALQRHNNCWRSKPDIDGQLNADLRSCVDTESLAKYQPDWFEALYNLLINKQSNIQFGIDVEFPYSNAIVRSAKVVDLFVDAWTAMSQLLALVLGSVEE